MLRVVCVRTGTKYGPEYVERLRDMISRNLEHGTAGQFECITDQPETFPGIVNQPAEDLGGWWSKMGLFIPHRWPEGDRIWFFDLDTLITGPLDDILKYDGPFAALDDLVSPGSLQSSVMTWRAGECDDIWQRWVSDGMPTPAGGDQVVIGQARPQFVRLQRQFPRSFVSYKMSCQYGIPHGARVVCFHGEPRPHDVKSGWVPQVWKVGGGTALELVVVGNTPFDDVVANVNYACALDTEWLRKRPALPEGENELIIVGGGPSINQMAPLLKHRSKTTSMMALNGSAAWCSAHGILIDFHVMIDARPEMADMVTAIPERIFASQCAPDVTMRADVLFHARSDGVDPSTHGGADFEVGGGCSVGMLALSVAYALGYRKLRLFGYDSSYSGDEGHAYDQALNADELVIDVNLDDGRKFRAAPWMVQQAREYMTLAPMLVEMGCEITVEGSGLLPEIHKLMCASCSAADLRAAAVTRRLNGAPEVRGVEVGTYVGDLAVKLLQTRPGLTLTCVDPYAAPAGASPWTESGDYHARMTQAEHDAAFAKATGRLEQFGDRALLIRAPSVEAAELFADKSQDFVFIDGDHSYEGVCADIEAWAPKVRDGGWLCGHDYRNTHIPFPGVERAVDEWACGRGVETGDNFTWFVRMGG